MSAGLVLPIALPLGSAALSLALGRRPLVRRWIGFLALAGSIAACLYLLIEVSDGSVIVGHVGDVASPIGITLVVDTFSAIMLSISSIMLLAVYVYAVGSPRTHAERSVANQGTRRRRSR